MGTFNLGGLGVAGAGTLVAAYGSNLDPALMAERVGPYEVYSVGHVPGYRLAFAGHSRRWNGPVATLVKDSNAEEGAPVVVYRLDADQMKKLDANEGVAIGVYRKEKLTVDTAFERLKITVYLHNSPEGGKPPTEYAAVIARGYKAFGLDQAVLKAAIRKAK